MADSPTEAFTMAQAFNEDGVDLTLIRWMLSLFFEDRLQVLQDHLDTIQMMHSELTIDLNPDQRRTS